MLSNKKTLERKAWSGRKSRIAIQAKVSGWDISLMPGRAAHKKESVFVLMLVNNIYLTCLKSTHTSGA